MSDENSIMSALEAKERKQAWRIVAPDLRELSEEWDEWASEAGSVPGGPIGKADGKRECARELREVLEQYE